MPHQLAIPQLEHQHGRALVYSFMREEAADHAGCHSLIATHLPPRVINGDEDCDVVHELQVR
jgi:hypothetical protein